MSDSNKPKFHIGADGELVFDSDYVNETVKIEPVKKNNAEWLIQPVRYDREGSVWDATQPLWFRFLKTWAIRLIRWCISIAIFMLAFISLAIFAALIISLF